MVSPKKSALGKYLELALYGFQMIPFYSKEDFLGHDDPSGPLLGHPKMYSTSWDPIFNPWSAFERQEKLKLSKILKPIFLDILYF